MHVEMHKVSQETKIQNKTEIQGTSSNYTIVFSIDYSRGIQTFKHHFIQMLYNKTTFFYKGTFKQSTTWLAPIANN